MQSRLFQNRYFEAAAFEIGICFQECFLTGRIKPQTAQPSAVLQDFLPSGLYRRRRNSTGSVMPYRQISGLLPPVGNRFMANIKPHPTLKIKNSLYHNITGFAGSRQAVKTH
jgi:hypothetical protein